MEYFKFNTQMHHMISGDDLASVDIIKLHDEKAKFISKNKRKLRDCEDPNFVLEMVEAIFGVNYLNFLNHTHEKSIDKQIKTCVDILNERFNLKHEAKLIQTVHDLNVANILLESDPEKSDFLILKAMTYLLGDAPYNLEYFNKEALFAMHMLTFERFCLDGEINAMVHKAFDLINDNIPQISYLGEKATYHLLNNIFADMAITMFNKNSDFDMAIGFVEEVVKNYNQHLAKYHYIDDAILTAEIIHHGCLAAKEAEIYNIALILYKRFYDFIKEKKIMSNNKIMCFRRRLNRKITDDILNKCYQGVDSNDLYTILLSTYKSKSLSLSEKESDDWDEMFMDNIVPKIEKMVTDNNYKDEDVVQIGGEALESYARYLIQCDDLINAKELFYKSVRMFYQHGVTHFNSKAILRAAIAASFVGELMYGVGDLATAKKIWTETFATYADNIKEFDVEAFAGYGSIALNLTSLLIETDEYSDAMIVAYDFLADYDRLGTQKELDAFDILTFQLGVIHFNLGVALLNTRGKDQAQKEFEIVDEILKGIKEKDGFKSFIIELSTLSNYAHSLISSGVKELTYLNKCIGHLKEFAHAETPTYLHKYRKFKDDASYRIKCLTDYADEA